MDDAGLGDGPPQGEPLPVCMQLLDSWVELQWDHRPYVRTLSLASCLGSLLLLSHTTSWSLTLAMPTYVLSSVAAFLLLYHLCLPVALQASEDIRRATQEALSRQVSDVWLDDNFGFVDQDVQASFREFCTPVTWLHDFLVSGRLVIWLIGLMCADRQWGAEPLGIPGWLAQLSILGCALPALLCPVCPPARSPRTSLVIGALLVLGKCQTLVSELSQLQCEALTQLLERHFTTLLTLITKLPLSTVTSRQLHLFATTAVLLATSVSLMSSWSTQPCLEPFRPHAGPASVVLGLVVVPLAAAFLCASHFGVCVQSWLIRRFAASRASEIRQILRQRDLSMAATTATNDGPVSEHSAFSGAAGLLRYRGYQTGGMLDNHGALPHYE